MNLEQTNKLAYAYYVRKMRNIGILRELVPKHNKGLWAPRDVKRWLGMVGAPATYPCVVEFIPDSEDFLVAILRQNNADINSYVETRVRPDDPMYIPLKQKVSILNVSGDDSEVEGYGARYTANYFAVLLTKDEHDQLLK